MQASDPMDMIMQQADKVATDMLSLIEDQLKELKITEVDMIRALQFAITTKMYEKAKNNLPKEK